jgi:hypothetical protein
MFGCPVPYYISGNMEPQAYLIVFNGDVCMSPHKVHLNAAEGEQERIPTQPAPDTETEKAVLQIRIMARETETENAYQDHDTRGLGISKIAIFDQENRN